MWKNKNRVNVTRIFLASVVLISWGELRAAPVAGSDFSTSAVFNGGSGSADLDAVNTDDLNASDGISVSPWAFNGGGAFRSWSDGAQIGMPQTVVIKLDGDGNPRPLVGTLPAGLNEFSFSITIPAGKTLNLSSVTWSWRKSTTSTDTRWLAFRTSLDEQIIFSKLGQPRNGVDNETVALSAPKYQNLTDQIVTFYWYAGGEGTGDIDIDTIIVNGDMANEASSVVISEFMAKNDAGLSNNPNNWYPIANQIPGTSEDWIELSNETGESVDLSGWALTDDAGDLSKWIFPTGTSIASGAYLIVYASGDNAPDANGNLHTNFKLSGGGEYLALVDPSQIVISAYGPNGTDYPAQNNDISYGLNPVNGTSVFFNAPTPGSTNDSSGIARVEKMVFSPSRGYYQTAMNVTLANGTAGVTTYYTTDGMPPVDAIGAPTPTAQVYSGPISLSKTTAIRAVSVMAGLTASEIETHTYFLFDIDGAAANGTDAGGLNISFLQQTQPAGWGDLTSGDFNMDTSISQLTSDASGHTTSTAQTMLSGLRDIPTISIVMDRDEFSGNNGIYTNSEIDDLEYGCSAEFIPALGDSRDKWQINCGIKVQGGASRTPANSPKHSLNFRFRTEYGASKLREPIFPDSEVKEFNSISLRAGYNNSWIHRTSSQRARASMIRDQWVRQSMLDMGNPSAGHGFMVHVFINGLYWGVHNLTERPEASHYAAYNGGDEDVLDARNGSSLVDGNFTAWNAIEGVVNDGDWEKIQDVIDIDQYIDYQIINRYGANQDLKVTGNWRSAGGGPFPNGQPEMMAPWQLFSWDAERTLESQSSSSTPIDPMGVRGTLENHAEYKIRFADRLQKHFLNQGALTAESTKARWKKLADLLDRAIIAESARWGDDRRTPAYTRDAEWLTEQNRLYNSYFPSRSATVFNNYGNLFPNTDTPVFLVNATPQHGGDISNGETLSATANSGSIYYTTDGSDPRLDGGSINPTAIFVSSGSTLSLSGSGLIRMRAKNGGEWSAIEEATFYLETLAQSGDLAITELHYRPYRVDATEQAAGSTLPAPRVFERDDFEFIEVRNISASAVNLDGTSFTDGISYTFGVMTLPPNGFVVLAKDTQAFALRYPSVNHVGDYSGKLSDGGETIKLVDASGNVMHHFIYDDSGAWPGRADGHGSSLELTDTASSANNYSDPNSWRSSCEFNGSPNVLGVGFDGRIVINEVMSHTDLPSKDTIELHNTTGNTVNLANWILSDDNGSYTSFSIPNIQIPAGGYVIFDEDDFNITPTQPVGSYSGTIATSPTTVNVSNHGRTTGDTVTIKGYGGISTYNDTFQVTVIDANNFTINTPFYDNHSTKGQWISGRPFALSAAHGDDLWLLETDNSGRPVQFVDHVDFAASFNGEALGRWPNATGSRTLVSMSQNTLGSENLGAQVGPVVISEVMYHPNTTTENNLEYIEICNHGSVTENLDHWRMRGGADFDFTASHSLNAGATLVLVAFDPELDPGATSTFRSVYSIDSSIPLIGPFTDGPLGNDTGTVRLQRPDSPPSNEPDFYPQVTEDEVIYYSTAPWPLEAGGAGASLNRLDLALFGNFASSWSAQSPTPGGKRNNYTDWTTAWGVGDETQDFEGDSIQNILEFALDLNPRVSDANLLPLPVMEGDYLTLSYPKNILLDGITYKVQYSTDLQTWLPVSDTLMSRSNFTEVRKASVPLSANSRIFMRLRIDY